MYPGDEQGSEVVQHVPPWERTVSQGMSASRRTAPCVADSLAGRVPWLPRTERSPRVLLESVG